VAAITPVVVGRVSASSSTALGPSSSKSRCPGPEHKRMDQLDALVGEVLG
jgi:hypothetical protein